MLLQWRKKMTKPSPNIRSSTSTISTDTIAIVTGNHHAASG